MDEVIYKYPLNMRADTILALPHGAHPVHVAEQGGLPQIWIRHAMPQKDEPTWDHAFRIVGTGQPFPKGTTHVGTFQAGPYVWHVLRLPF